MYFFFSVLKIKKTSEKKWIIEIAPETIFSSGTTSDICNFIPRHKPLSGVILPVLQCRIMYVMLSFVPVILPMC